MRGFSEKSGCLTDEEDKPMQPMHHPAHDCPDSSATSASTPVDEHAAFTRGLLNLAVRIDSFGRTRPSIAEAVRFDPDAEYITVRR